MEGSGSNSQVMVCTVSILGESEEEPGGMLLAVSRMNWNLF
jgi:hypothetical protein